MADRTQEARERAEEAFEMTQGREHLRDNPQIVALALDVRFLADRVSTLETALREMLGRFEEAASHIVDDLQPAFEMLADTGRLPWPKSWNPDGYNQRQAAMRLATWWHGAWTEEHIQQARAALAGAATELEEKR